MKFGFVLLLDLSKGEPLEGFRQGGDRVGSGCLEDRAWSY